MPKRKRPAFYAAQRRRRAIRHWLRLAEKVIAGELGCSEHPWFRLTLKN